MKRTSTASERFENRGETKRARENSAPVIEVPTLRRLAERVVNDNIGRPDPLIPFEHDQMVTVVGSVMREYKRPQSMATLVEDMRRGDALGRPAGVEYYQDRMMRTPTWDHWYNLI